MFNLIITYIDCSVAYFSNLNHEEVQEVKRKNSKHAVSISIEEVGI